MARVAAWERRHPCLLAWQERIGETKQSLAKNKQARMPALRLMTDEWKRRLHLPKAKTSSAGAPLWYSRGYLPHFDMPGLTQTMTFRLFDSMPQAMLELWREELRQLPKDELNLERRKRIDAYLDQGHGSCYLKGDRLAGIVQKALL